MPEDYGMLKVVKEFETYIVCWRSSQSKYIAKYLPYKEQITLLSESLL